MDPFSVPPNDCGKHQFRWDETPEGLMFWCPGCSRAYYLVGNGEGENRYLSLRPFVIEHVQIEELEDAA